MSTYHQVDLFAFAPRTRFRKCVNKKRIFFSKLTSSKDLSNNFQFTRVAITAKLVLAISIHISVINRLV
jgi:hypothetical protein